MEIKVYNKIDLSRPIDTASIDNCNVTIIELLDSIVDKYEENSFKNVDIFADGIQIPQNLWKTFNINKTRNLSFVVNPEDVISIVGLIVAIVAAAMSFVMASKVKTPKQENTSSQTSSIYDPNAQGNKVKLEDPIPEQFGFVKSFPDLISDYHYFYRRNQRYMSVLLCQGVGYFDHSIKNIYIGNTPLTDFADNLVNCKVYNPGEDLSDHEAHVCWYSSTEVTASGHEIVPSKNGESTDTEKIKFVPSFQGDTFKSYKSDFHITGVNSQGVQGQTSLTPYALKYDVDDIFKITDCDPLIDLDVLNTDNEAHFINVGDKLRIYVDEFPMADNQLDTLITYECHFKQNGGYSITPGGTPIYIPVISVSFDGYATYGTDDNGKYFEIQTNVQYDDRCTGYKYLFYFSKCISYITKAQGEKDCLQITDTQTIVDKTKLSYLGDVNQGDYVTIVYNEEYYTGIGPSRHKNNYDTTFRAKIEDVTEDSIIINKSIDIQYRIDSGVYEYYSSNFMIQGYTDFDTVYRDCNGYYRVKEKISDYEFKVEAVDSETFDYQVINNWYGFPCTGAYTCNSTLLMGANANNGVQKPSTAGPYRACPIGAESQIYEIDIRFPSGIYHMNSSGKYESHTAKVLIEYADINSDVWASEEHSFTYATPNELGFTFRFEVQPNVSLRFKVTNISDYTEDAQIMQKMVWNGLKCVIAQPSHYDDVTVIALTVRGDETLSESNENQISTFWTRKLPDLTTGRMLITQDVVPAVGYICTKSRYKDLFNLSSWSEYNHLTQDANIEFNFRFDEKTTILEALRDVLQIGYAEPIVVGNEIIPKRKYATDEIVQMFTPSNMTQAPKVEIQLLTEDTDDEINISYMDGTEEQETASLHGENVTWKDTEIFVDIDPKTNETTWQIYQNSDNVQTVKALTLTSRESAFRLASRKLREMTFCRTKYSFQTEMDALNCQYGDVVLLALPQSVKTWFGSIIAYKDNVITIDKKVNEDDVNGIIYLRKPNGSTASSECVYIDSKHILLTTPQEWISEWFETKSNVQERPYFAFGEVVKCWVTSIKPNNNKCSVECINYDDRIFKDDPF